MEGGDKGGMEGGGGEGEVKRERRTIEGREGEERRDRVASALELRREERKSVGRRAV
jgi:hypothetical protein